MKLAYCLFAGAAILAAPFAASADVSYSYFDFDYIQVDSDSSFGRDEETGFGISGSFAINDSWYWGVGRGEVENTSATDLGFGWHSNVSEVADLYAEAAFVRVENDFFSESGNVLGVGVRGNPTGKVELSFGVQRTKIEDFSDTSIGAGFVIYFSEKFGFGASLSSSDEGDSLALGFRALL